MKDDEGLTAASPPDRGEGANRVVRFRLRESDFKTLEALARARRKTIPELITEALPLVIEKFRVLRALDIQPQERAAWRRGRGRPQRRNPTTKK